DVPVSHQFYREVSWLAYREITGGYPDGTFGATNPVTRAAMAAFLYRLAGEPAYTPPTSPRFTDVPLSHPFYKEISWLSQTGITSGYSDGTFRGGSVVTRDAMAAFLYRYDQNI